MKKLQCKNCGYANFAENIKCEKCGSSLFGDPRPSQLIKEAEPEEKEHQKISLIWYALAIIIPNSVIRIITMNGQIPYIESHFASSSSYIFGACLGTIIIVSIICAVANLLAKVANVESTPLAKFVVTVLLSYIIYWALILFI